MTNKMMFLFLAVFFGALINNYVDACSCSPTHPQQQYCTADFVIVARIRKETTTEQHRVYKVKIRKEFKMSVKAKIALNSGRILTAIEGAACGSYLEVGKIYLITGYIHGLRAHINLCGFVKPWNEVTARQRKGFRLIYSRGCSCKISNYNFNRAMKDRCVWNNYVCQSDYGICLKSPSGQCHWSKSIDLKRCINGELKPEFIKPSLTSNIYPEPIREKDKYIDYNRGKYYYKKTDDLKTS